MIRLDKGIGARARSVTRGHVLHGQELVGHIAVDRHRAIHFRYAPSWLDSPRAFPVSVHMPLWQGDDWVNAHGFFEGLLPEGNPRRRICVDLGLDPDDDASLLFALGEDCAGALSVLAEDVEPSAPEEAAKPISDRELSDLVQRRGQPATYSGGGMRFSLAGAQEKVTVRVDGDRLYWPNAALASTHILKFETLPHVCMSEYAGLRLASLSGLSAIAPELRVLGDKPVPYLRLPRYDREIDAQGAVWRVHQEDMIQALGYESRHKYEGDGGPGLADVARLLREHADRPLEAITALMRWQIFNYLIGNSDAHGKNLALLYRRGASGGVMLAPFYDLVAIDSLNRLRAPCHRFSRAMAFSIGGAMRPERVGRAAWQGFSRDLGVRPRRVERELEAMATQLPDHGRRVRAELDGLIGAHQKHRVIEKSLAARCAWALRTLGHKVRTHDLLESSA